MAVSSAVALARSRADAQVNARMDSELKRSGDAALAKAGWTPTQAVRALWAFASKHATEPEKVASVFSSADDTVPEDIERAERIRRRRELVARGPKLMEESCKAMGIPWPPTPIPWTDEEWKEQAYVEQFGEKWWER